MKNKHLLIIMLALLAPLAMWGQETLKLYEDAYYTTYQIPVQGSATNRNDLKCEYIIPASDLAAMAGKNIYAIDYFPSTPASGSWGTAQFQVFLKEVEEAEFPSSSPSFYGTDNATVVYTGSLDATSEIMTIPFSTGYAYSGGNLLVGIYITQTGTAKSAFFYAKSTNVSWMGPTTYPAYQGSNGSYARKTYIPRSNFIYASEPVTYIRPRNLMLTDLTSTSATITWTNGGNETAWQIVYSTVPDFDPDAATPTTVSSKPYTLDGLTTGTTYYACLRSDYGSGHFSAWSDKIDITPECFPVFNFAATATTPNSATLTWTSYGTETSWQLVYSTNSDFDPDDATPIDITERPYTLNGLTAETTYYAYVRANCGDSHYSEWSNLGCFTPSNAIDELVVDGSNTNSYVPVYLSAVDFQTIRSQFIIPSDNLASIAYGHIKKLSFYLNPGMEYYASWDGADFEIYLMETENSSFSGNTLVDWSDMTKVYDGRVVINNNKMEIALPVAFDYEDGNLMVGINQKEIGASAYGSWLGTTTTSNTAIYGYGSSNSTVQFLPKTTISYFEGTAPTCLKPKNLTSYNIGSTSATLSWTAGGTETAWVLQYATDAEFTENVVSTDITTNPFSLSGLTSETTYYARVKADCGGEDYSSWSNTCSFTPSVMIMHTVNDGTITNYMVPIYGGGITIMSQSQFVLPASILTNMNGKNISKMTFYCAADNVTWGAAEFDVCFKEVDYTSIPSETQDWTGMTTVYSGSLSVSDGLMTIVFDNLYTYQGGNLLIGVKQTVAGTNSSCYWYGVSTSSNTAVGGFYGTYFYDYSFLPKLTFAYYGDVCNQPDGLAFSGVTFNSATLSWNANDGSNWQVQYKASTATDWSNPISVNETPSCTINNLNSGTEYQVRVRTDCGGDYYSEWATATFETTCGVAIPYSYNFDSDAAGANAAFPHCWTRYNDATNASYQCYPQVYNNTNNAHSAPNTLCFRALADDNYPNTQMAILPEVNTDVNTLMLNFWAATSTGGTLKIGVMTDPDDVTTYTEVGTVSIANNGATHPTKYSFNLSPYQGDGRYIAIRMDKTTTNSVIFVDDINLETVVSATIPYTHNFDVDETGVYAGAPDGWIFIGNKYPRVYQGNAHSGSNDLMIFHDGNNPNIRQMAVLPEMDYTIQGLQIVFWAKTWDKMTMSNLRVGVMTDPNDPTTFTQVESFHVGKDYNEHTVTFENYTGQGKYIAISDWAYNDNNTYFLIDDIIVEPIPSCRKPGQPYVNSYEIQAHQVRMTWQKGTEDQALWQLALGTEANFNPDLVTPIDVDVNNPDLFDGEGTWCAYYLTGLDAATTYYVYVRANCGTVDEPDYSDWSALYCEFTTLGCDIPTGLSMASYTSTTAHLWWNSDNGLASEYELAYSTDEYFDPEFPDDETHVITGITELGYTIEGLTAETVYYACVRANCGADGYSDWSETISFMPSAYHDMTLYDDWEISQRAPLSLSYVHYDPDQNQQGIRGQYVLPEIHLSELRFSNIHSISLFTANTSLDFYNDALFNVYVAAVDEPTMNGFISFDAMTQVYSGTLSIIDGVMTVSFTTPFYYSEGSLMIGFKQITVGDAHNTAVTWKGIDSHVASCYTYDYWFETEEYGFSSTTRFRYEPCNAPSCPRPRMLKALPMSTFAKLSWSNGNGTCDVQYKKTTDAEWTLVEGVSITTYQPYVLRNLAPSTEYVYQVRNVCSDTEHSDWSKSCYFTTRSDEPIVIDVDHLYTEGFDEAVFPPTDWVTESASYVSYWKQRETTQEHYLVAYSGYYNDAMMYSPELHINAQGAVLTIKHMHNSSLNGTATYCDIMVSTDHGEHFSQLWGGRDVTLVGDWITTRVSLDEYVNQDIVLEFYHLTYNANHAWDINEIQIKAFNKVFNGSDNDNSWGNTELWSSNNGELPTADDEVLINSEVTIPYGTVATAGQIYLNSAENNEEIQGSITIEDGGQLLVNDTVTVTMQTDVNGYGRGGSNWYLIAPPVTQSMMPSNNNVSGVLTGSYDLYKFDGSYEGAEWRNYKQSQYSFVFQNGHGYLFANSANTSPSFKGTVLPSNQTKTIDLDFAGTTFGGWNLIGNPFTCNAYLTQNNGYIAYYRMNEDGDAIVLASSSDPIKPCEGVFVQCNENTITHTATFTATAPSRGEGMNFSLSKAELTRDGTSTGSATLDRTRIQFGEGQNLGHLDLMADPNRLYIPMSGKELAVVCTQPVGELPLNFEVAANGTYTLDFENVTEGMMYCHLIDNLTGTDVDLLQQPEYTFNAKVSDYASRFKVVFVANGPSAGSGTDGSETFAFNSNGNWIIANEGSATLQVIDVNGRILRSEQINGFAETRINTAAGVYVLRLVNGEKVRTQKVIVK